MKAIPTGWTVVRLDQLVEILDGRRIPVSAPERAKRPGEVPYYGASGQVGTIDKALFNESLLLLGEDGVQFFDPLKSKAYQIRGRSWVNNHAHVLRVKAGTELTLLEYYLNQFDYRGFANGTTRLKLTQAAMRRIPVVLPDLKEQRRIVAILEEHLSDLDDARRSLEDAICRSANLATALLWRSTHELDGSRRVRLDEIAEVRLGRQRSPKNHNGPRMRPYLRAANVDWNWLRLDDVSEMNFTEAEEDIYRLMPGDILLAEASGSAAEVGKSVIYEGKPPNVCFQNTLLRVRCHSAQPKFVQKYLLAEARAGRFMPASRGVGINHLGRARLAGLVVDLPNEAVQREAAQRVEDLLDQLSRTEQVVRNDLSRAASLRQAVLAAAFSGRLTGHGSDTDVISELAEEESA